MPPLMIRPEVWAVGLVGWSDLCKCLNLGWSDNSPCNCNWLLGSDHPTDRTLKRGVRVGSEGVAESKAVGSVGWAGRQAEARTRPAGGVPLLGRYCSETGRSAERLSPPPFVRVTHFVTTHCVVYRSVRLACPPAAPPALLWTRSPARQPVLPGAYAAAQVRALGVGLEAGGPAASAAARAGRPPRGGRGAGTRIMGPHRFFGVTPCPE